MNLENSHVVLKTIDNTARILFWRVDEVFIVMIPFIVGFLFSSILVMFLGFTLRYCYSRLRKNSYKMLQHRLYWYLPTDAFVKTGIFKNIPRSHLRKFSL